MLIGGNSQGIIKVLEIQFDLIHGHNVMFHTHTLLGYRCAYWREQSRYYQGARDTF